MASIMQLSRFIRNRRKFKLALPGYHYSFPRDHCAHKEFQIEWWYHVGHLDTENGGRFGYELTFFRRAIERPFEALITLNQDLYFAHFALTDKNEKRFAYFQRINILPDIRAKADENRLCVTNGAWSLKAKGDAMHLHVKTKAHGLNLRLVPVKPPVMHGLDGVSQKADGVGRASHYISITRSQTTGQLTFAGKQHRVSGISWMDHEFGSNQLTSQQVGWDWFCIQLENDVEVMVYLMRKDDGTFDHNSSGTVVHADGASTHIRSNEFSVTATGKWTSPKSGGTYPMGWIIRIPGQDMELKITPAVEDQELAALNSKGVSYWEGASDVEACIAGSVVPGACYAELIGYAEALPRDM
jgi:predicted secreted hydrolase